LSDLAPLALLTQHGKLEAVRGPLEAAGFAVFLQGGFDTDKLGTFTGEIARHGSQLDAALAKARKAAELSGARFGLGSEGSFGPDPHIGMSAWGCEVLAWWDAALGCGVHAVEQGLQTNFVQTLAHSLEEARAFASEVGFPAHGVIVGKPGTLFFTKELPPQADAFEDAVSQALAYGPAWLETDMRAHRNPTRMAMIARCADTLAAQLRCSCPACDAPGFGPKASLRGARCERCSLPTSALRARLLGCSADVGKLQP
jgi:hypothetical protein